MDLAEALTYPNATLRVLAVLTAGDTLATWTDNGDGTWTAPLTHADSGGLVGAVELNGAALSLGADWTWDPQAQTVTVEEAALGSPADPRLHNLTAVLEWHAANLPYTRDGRVYRGDLIEVPTISLRCEEVFGDDVPQLGGGAVQMGDVGGLASRFPRLAFREMELDLGADVAA